MPKSSKTKKKGRKNNSLHKTDSQGICFHSQTTRPHFLPTREGLCILSLLDLSHHYSPMNHNSPLATTSEPKWRPPKPNFIKLNYDKESKYNLGNAGFGSVFRDHAGQIIWIYYGNPGHTTNNVAKLQAWDRGLAIAIDQNFWPLFVERDSMVSTQYCKKIQLGRNINLVSNSWRLKKTL